LDEKRRASFFGQSCDVVDAKPIPFRYSDENHSISPGAKLLLDLANHNKNIAEENGRRK